MHKEAYEGLRVQHPELPQYEELDKEFDISSIEKQTHLLRDSRRKINDKMETIIDLLERILQPDPSRFIDLYEYRTFTELEKKEIFQICKTFVYQQRQNLEADITLTKDMDARTVRTMFDTWMQHKPKILMLIQKLKEHWKQNVKTKEILEYLG